MDRNAPMTIPELDLLNFIGFLSDLTCTKKYALTEEPNRGGELMWATHSASPSHFMLTTSLGKGKQEYCSEMQLTIVWYQLAIN